MENFPRKEKYEMDKLQSLPALLQIRRSYKGVSYLLASLELALENEDLLLFPGQTIFPAVAKRYHVNLCCIERDIRTVIDHCWHPESRQALRNLAPYPLNRKPTVCEFLDILYWYLLCG